MIRRVLSLVSAKLPKDKFTIYSKFLRWNSQNIDPLYEKIEAPSSVDFSKEGIYSYRNVI